MTLPRALRCSAWLGGLLLLLALAGCAPARLAVDAAPRQAWVQAASDGRWVVRALTDAGSCPVLRWQAGEQAMQQAMQLRAAPAVIAPRAGAAQAEAKPSVFALRSCEASLPAGAQGLQVGGLVLPAPAAEIRRIVLIADTGCRLKQSDQAFQDCNDPARWPFAAIAASAAASKPDLVIHLGDLHYRESPCPAGRPGCADSPWGYGDDAWQADFFRPAAPLLAAAPWLFVRGNHESCGRAGAGWMRALDAQPWTPSRACQDPANDAEGDFSPPHAVPLTADSQFIVFDSAFAAGKPYRADHPVAKRYAAQLIQVQQLAAAKPHSLFLNHHPVLGFGGSAGGAPKPGNAGLQSVMAAAHPARLFADGIDLVLSGHVHLFQALGFSSGHPGAVVLGNSGSAMEGFVDETAALRAQPAPGAVVQTFASHPGFGFATLDRAGQSWQLSAWSVAGQLLRRCTLRGPQISCEAAP